MSFLLGYFMSIYRQHTGVVDSKTMFKPANLSKDERNLLIKFSQQEPNYHEWPDNLKIEMGFNPFLSDWKTPSINLMAHLLLFHEEFVKLGSFYGGPQDCHNLWIVKPASNARGHGIFITNSLEDILSDEKNENVGKDTLVQKYLETPLLLTLGEHDYKFDIRQWVLVTSLSPLTIYIFEGFYCRMCSNPYDVANFKDVSRHLTNFSVNKANFKEGTSLKSSVLDDQFLKDYLREHRGVDWEEEMQPKIEAIIIEAIRASCQNMKHRERSFEVYGFDIIIDSILNPYLLEVNLSPACEEREDFLSKMLEDMTVDLFSILKEKEIELNEGRLDRAEAPKPQKTLKTQSGLAEDRSGSESPTRLNTKLEAVMEHLKLEDMEAELQYHWKHIFTDDQNNEFILRPGSENYICVTGTPFNVKLENVRDKRLKSN